MKLDKVLPVDLSDIIAPLRQRINRVGIELEGGWKKLENGVRLIHDGSVRIEEPVASPREVALATEINRISLDYNEVPSALMEEYRTLHNARLKSMPKHTGELQSVPFPLLGESRPLHN